MSDIDARFAKIEIDDNDSAAAAVAVAPRPVTPAPLPEQLRGQETDTASTYGDIDTEGRARAIQSALAAQAHGLIPSEATYYSWGTRGQWGDAARKARLEHRARPLLSDAVRSVRDLVAAEKRRADARQIPALTYGADDLLRKRGSTGEGARMTRRAFGQLLQRAGAAPYAAGYLGHESVPATLRAPHMDHWLAKAVDTEVMREKGKPPVTVETPREVVLLSKLDAEGRRYVYGAVSDSYVRYDLDRAIADLQAALPPETRVTVRYCPESTRWTIDASLGAEFEPVVGDIHRVAMRVSSGDAGGDSCEVSLWAERARCLNFSKVQLKGKAARVRHVGRGVAERIRALFEVQAEALAAFADCWRAANQEALISEALADGEARDVYRALIEAGHLPAPDGTEIAVERYYSAWLAEPGHTRADFVNGATRAAHEAAWSSPWAGEAIEEAAGELLYQQVVIVPTWRQEAGA